MLWRQAPKPTPNPTSVRSLLPPVPLEPELGLAEDDTKAEETVEVAGAEAPADDVHRWLLVGRMPAVTAFVS